MRLKEQIEAIVFELYNLQASDIHFQPYDEITKIFYRKWGILYEFQEISTADYLRIISYIKYMGNLNIGQKNEPQDGTIEMEIEDLKINIRVSTIPLIKNESLVLRIINGEIARKTEELTWNSECYHEIVKLINSKVGLFIFTGPTGSGKTTLMYHILKELVEKKNLKVITIENPIEIRSKLFVQMQINEQKNINYELALKSVLRQDPDIIMIGEIRDLQTAKAVMRAALTGHTIITTMHTKNKFGVIERFRDFGFSDSEINSVLIGICNQRLVTIKYPKILIDYIDLSLADRKWGEHEKAMGLQIKELKQRIGTKTK